MGPPYNEEFDEGQSCSWGHGGWDYRNYAGAWMALDIEHLNVIHSLVHQARSEQGKSSSFEEQFI